MSDTATLQPEALRPRQPAGMGTGLLLALLAHALLIAALTFGLRWKTSDPAGIEAELWAAVPQVAAPRAAAPEPVPAKPKPAEPPPPEPRPPEPPAKVEPTPQQALDAQIAIEKARQEQERLEKERELRAKEEAERKKREQLAKEEAERRKQEQLAKEEAERKKKEQVAKEEAERKKKEQLAKEEAERKKKEQLAKEKEQARLLAEAREANLKRIQGQAGASGAPSDRGTAARTAGPSSGYAGRIKARIQPNIVFPDTVEGNPLASVEVRLASDGTILSRRLIRSSGLKAWDDAVLRAIDKTEQLPRDVDGRVPSVMEIDFRPRD
jgi:colicin import membrane protein